MAKPMFFTGPELRREVAKILSKRGERIVLTAYVGDKPLALLGSHPRGIRLYCWPALGSTSGNGVKRLLDAKVDVRFVDGLHAKLYWCKQAAIVGSANLSDAGLGAKAGREIGVRLSKISAKEILALVHDKSRKPSPEEIERLRKAWKKSGRGVGKPEKKSANVPTFTTWLRKPTTNVVFGITKESPVVTKEQRAAAKQIPELNPNESWCLDRKTYRFLQSGPRKDWTLDFFFPDSSSRKASIALSYSGKLSSYYPYRNKKSYRGFGAVFALSKEYWPNVPFKVTPKERGALVRYMKRLYDRFNNSPEQLDSWESALCDENNYIHLKGATCKRFLNILKS
jgi:hypothetical protein